MTRPGVVWASTLAVAACGRGSEAHGTRLSDTTRADESAPAESLVATREGVEIWFTLARPGRGGSSPACVDRAIEIRRDGTRIPVPLLYTHAVPRFLDDTTARAVLSTDCVGGPAYHVDLRTGRPTPEIR